ncbi:MAG TPA: glycosyltransferase family 39 protein, partial [Thermoanaerobaculia bacterium]|nr:glycosyltransferase family 39 protein [Thermoanaerobaculia bacterium]
MSPSQPAADRRALAAAACLFLALALFGARYHWVEEAGTAERDGYVAEAQQLLAGHLPHDPFRPLLYPLLTAGLGVALRDPFAAARLISNLAAAALAWLAYRTGRELGTPENGAWVGAGAMAVTAVNPNLWILGQHVTTDMLFGALAAGILLAGLIYLKRPAPAPALAAGLLLGLAAFTRGNAIFLLPALLLAVWKAP